MMTKRVALYLQDACDLRDGLEYARYAEENECTCSILYPVGEDVKLLIDTFTQE